MLFTTFDYACLLALVFTLYWTIRHRVAQNVLLLAASYTFYGWIHPWFCLLIASSTVVEPTTRATPTKPSQFHHAGCSQAPCTRRQASHKAAGVPKMTRAAAARQGNPTSSSAGNAA